MANSPKEIEKLIKDLQKLASTSSDLSGTFDRIKSVLSTSGPLLQSQVTSFTKLTTQSKQLVTILNKLSKGYGSASSNAKTILSDSSKYTAELKKQVTLSDKLARNIAKVRGKGTSSIFSNPAGRTSSRRSSNKPVDINTSTLEKELKKQTQLLQKLVDAVEEEEKSKKTDPAKKKKTDAAADKNKTNFQKTLERVRKELKELSFKGLSRRIAEKAGNAYETLKTEQQFQFGEERKKFFDTLLGESTGLKKKVKPKKDKSKEDEKSKPGEEKNKKPESKDVRAETLGGRGIETVVLEVGRGIIEVLEEIRDCMGCKRSALTEDPRLKGSGWRRTESGQTASYAEVERMKRRERLFGGDERQEKADEGIIGDIDKEADDMLNRLPGLVSIPMTLLQMGFNIMLKLATELERPIKEITTELGIGAGKAEKMSQEVRAIYVSSGRTAVSFKEMQDAMMGVSKEYEGLILNSEYYKKGIDRIARTAKYIGISSQEMSQFSEVLRRQTLGQSAEVAANFATLAAKSAEVAGVSPGIVTKDIIQNAGRLVAHFGGAPEKITKATIGIRKMGVSLKQAFDIEDTLMDFEGSITRSLEASVALGRNIDLTPAITAMMEGGPEAMMEEIKKLMSYEEFTNLLYGQKRLFADIFKMDPDEIQKMLYQGTEKFGENIEGDVQKAVEELQKGVGSVGIDDMDSTSMMPMEAMRNAADQIRQSMLAGNEGIIKGFANELGGFLEKFKGPLSNGIMEFAKAGAGFYKYVIEVISGKKTFSDVVNDTMDLIKEGIQWVIEKLTPVIDRLVEKIEEKLDNLRPFTADEKNKITQVQTSLTSQRDKFVQEQLKTGNFKDPNAQKKLEDEYNKSIKEYYRGYKTGIFGNEKMYSDDIARINAENAVLRATQNINDGIVQNGKVITTHPDDYIMAIKDPARIQTNTGNDMRLTNVEIVLKDILSVLRSNRSSPSVHYIDFGDGTVEKLNQRLRLVDTKYG